MEDLTVHTVRCCLCGSQMAPNPSNTCLPCLSQKINITEDIEKQQMLIHCKECNRFRRPPWLVLEPESPQLLSHCLKQIKGLKKLKLMDAAFIWTEPHSKRLKVRVNVQKEYSGTMLEKASVIEFVIQNHQCEDCKRTYTPHLWQSQVQVR